MPAFNLTFYYRSTDLNQYQNIQQTNLYAEKIGNNILGSAIYNLLTTVNTSTQNIDIESVTYFIGDNGKDCIFFNYSLLNTSVGNKFTEGFYEFEISGGQGLYKGATGAVYIYVDNTLQRTVKVIGETA